MHEANIKHSYHEHDYKIIADVHYNNKEDALKYRYTTNVPAIDGPVPPLVQAKLEEGAWYSWGHPYSLLGGHR